MEHLAEFCDQQLARSARRYGRCNIGVQDVPAPTDFYEAYSPIVVWNNVCSPSAWAYGARGRDAMGPANPCRRRNRRHRSLAISTQPRIRGRWFSGRVLFFLQPDAARSIAPRMPTQLLGTTLGTIAGFAPRCGAAAFVSREIVDRGRRCMRLFSEFNDIWSSSDGVSWTQKRHGGRMAGANVAVRCARQMTERCGWSAAMRPPIGTMPAELSRPRAGANHADVWYTKDGVDLEAIQG